MRARKIICRMLLMAIVALCGCAHDPNRYDEPHVGRHAHHRQGSAADANADRGKPDTSPAEIADSAEQNQEELLGEILAELDEIGTLDPELRKQLVENLRNTKPALWQPTIQAYRGALAYRERQEREKKSQPDTGEHPPEASASSVVTLSAPSDQLPADTASESLAVLPAAPQPAPEKTEVGKVSRMSAPPAPVDANDVSQGVVQVSHTAEAASPRDWRSHINQAIEILERETNSSSDRPEDVRGQVNLRMLYLAADRRYDAVRPISGASLTEQEFWSEQLYGLATYLDADRNADPERRAAEARRHFDDALTRLGELSTLTVRNLTFCTEASTYGVYKKFDSYEFTPGQEVVLYAEVENFTSRETEQGFHTTLRSTIEILDSRGHRVHTKEFAATEDVCHNRRRDFPMRYNLFLPERIWKGEYTLKLMIEDTAGKKAGESAIKFRIEQ